MVSWDYGGLQELRDKWVCGPHSSQIVLNRNFGIIYPNERELAFEKRFKEVAYSLNSTLRINNRTGMESVKCYRLDMTIEPFCSWWSWRRLSDLPRCVMTWRFAPGPLWQFDSENIFLDATIMFYRCLVLVVNISRAFLVALSQKENCKTGTLTDIGASFTWGGHCNENSFDSVQKTLLLMFTFHLPAYRCVALFVIMQKHGLIRDAFHGCSTQLICQRGFVEECKERGDHCCVTLLLSPIELSQQTFFALIERWSPKKWGFVRFLM